MQRRLSSDKPKFYNDGIETLKVQHLIKVEDPQQISPQASLFAAAPRPEDFQQPAAATIETESNEKDENK